MEVDMGQIDEEERPFMIVDKDTGRIYDVRNDAQVERLTGLATTKIGQQLRQTELEPGDQSKNVRQSMNTAWGDWWKQKKKSQQEFLWAAESGDLPMLKKYLDK